MAMKNNFSDHEWVNIRKTGLNRFALKHGVLVWGLFMFITMTTYNYLFIFDSSNGNLYLFLFRNALIWTVAGYLYGVWVFIAREKQFKKSQYH